MVFLRISFDFEYIPEKLSSSLYQKFRLSTKNVKKLLDKLSLLKIFINNKKAALSFIGNFDFLKIPAIFIKI